MNTIHYLLILLGLHAVTWLLHCDIVAKIRFVIKTMCTDIAEEDIEELINNRLEYINELEIKLESTDYLKHLSWLENEGIQHISEVRSNNERLYSKLSNLLGWSIALLGLLVAAIVQARLVYTIWFAFILFPITLAIVFLAVGLYISRRYTPYSLFQSDFSAQLSDLEFMNMLESIPESEDKHQYLETKVRMQKIKALYHAAENMTHCNRRVSLYIYLALALLVVGLSSVALPLSLGFSLLPVTCACG